MKLFKNVLAGKHEENRQLEHTVVDGRHYYNYQLLRTTQLDGVSYHSYLMSSSNFNKALTLINVRDAIHLTRFSINGN
jgi:hypothetical protein